MEESSDDIPCNSPLATLSEDSSSLSNSAQFADPLDWQIFFTTIGLNTKYVDKYVDIFVKNDVAIDMVPFLDHSVLSGMGVDKAGHRILILNMKEKIFFMFEDPLEYVEEVESMESVEEVHILHSSVRVKSETKTRQKRITYYVNEEFDVREKVKFDHQTINEFKQLVIERNKLTEEFAVFYLKSLQDDVKLEVIKENSTIDPGRIHFVIYHSLFKQVSKRILKQAKTGIKTNTEKKPSGKPIFTSENHPMVVDYVPDKELYLSEKGRLGLCMAPGRTKKKKNHDWNRDLYADLDRIKNFYGCDVLVSLVRTGEMRDIEVPDLLTEVVAHGMESVHYPIKDKSVPDSMTKLLDVVELIIEYLKESKSVVLHCNGGKGRSGTLIVATLIGLGRGINTSIEICRKARSGTIKNPLQIAYLKRFKKAWKKRKKLKSIEQDIKWSESKPEEVTLSSEDEILLSEEQKMYDDHQNMIKERRRIENEVHGGQPLEDLESHTDILKKRRDVSLRKKGGSESIPDTPTKKRRETETLPDTPSKKKKSEADPDTPTKKKRDTETRTSTPSKRTIPPTEEDSNDERKKKKSGSQDDNEEQGTPRKKKRAQGTESPLKDSRRGKKQTSITTTPSTKRKNQ